MLLRVLFFIFLINQNVDGDNPESSKEKLSKSLDLTKNIKTWKTIGIHKQLNSMYEIMNYRMYSLQCTYAYYALSHINVILKIKNELFMYWGILRWHVEEILQKYLFVAILTYSTISNMNYKPTKWMTELISLLRSDIKKHTIENKFKNLKDDLITVTKNPKCKPRKLKSIDATEVNKFLNDPILKQFNSYITEVENEDQYTFFSNHQKKFSRYEELKPNKKKSVYSTTDKENMFKLFKQPQIDIYRNIIQIVYLLYLNNLPSDTTINNTTVDEIIFYSLHEDKERYSTTNDEHHKEEIQKTKSLYNQVRPLLKTYIWHCTEIGSEIKELNEIYKVKDYSIISYRYEFALLSKVMNSMMINIEYTYAYFVYNHIENTVVIMNYRKESDNTIFMKNIQLYIAYFRVSLKTIATIFNKHYQAPDWMVEFIFYLEYAFVQERNMLSKICVIMLSMMSIALEKFKCDVTTLPKFEVKEKIQENFKKPLMSPQFQHLLLEITIMEYKENERAIIVRNIYNNLLQIHYILDMNKEILWYGNYNEFDPSKWILNIQHLNRTISEYLTWTMVNNSAQLKISTDMLMDSMLDTNTELYPRKQFKHAITVNNKGFALLRATLLRYVLTLSIYCDTTWYLVQETVSMNHQNLEKLTKLCSEIVPSTIDFVKWIGLEEIFVQHISTLLTQSLNFEDQTAATAADNSFIWGIAEFYLCLNLVNLNADVPIRSDASTQSQQPIQTYFTWIREVNLKLKNYIIAARQIYDGKHFSTHKILAKTFNNRTAYRYSPYV